MIRFRQAWAAAYARARYWLSIELRSPYQFTQGFEDFEDFNYHFEKHRDEHPAFRSAYGYAQFADTFCGGPTAVHILQHVRYSDGASVRCDPLARIVGVLHASRFIGTCHVNSKPLEWFQKEQMK